ncbi:MAG: phage tail tape measure protein, partial [Candidatus Heimdallarchaeaceae archaeon]
MAFAETRELDLILRLKDQATQQLKGFSGKMEKMKPAFQKMAVAGTAAFIGVGAGIYKATQQATDAQEIFNKFDVVFKDVGKEAEEVAKNLRNNFGLAESSAKDLLSATGDMLTGFGLSGESALDLSKKTQELAVDLASFTNIEGGAERASQALTKALLGERESVKELGIAILEEDVKAKVEAMEVAGEFTKETNREKKAIATLEIAISQSANAIGDFERTSGSLANQQRVLKERFKEATEAIGLAFMPVLQDVVEKMLPVITQATDWIKANQELTKKIVIAAAAITAFVAVVGTIGLVLPSVITGLGLLASAAATAGTGVLSLAGFLLSPVGLLVALTAVTVYIVTKAIQSYNDLQQSIQDHKKVSEDASAANQRFYDKLKEMPAGEAKENYIKIWKEAEKTRIENDLLVQSYQGWEGVLVALGETFEEWGDIAWNVFN